MVRSDKELGAILTKNPFKKADGAQVGVILFGKPVPKDFQKGVSTTGREVVKTARREVYIHYPDGMGRSKLKLPTIAKEGTMRNINTLTKMLGLIKN